MHVTDVQLAISSTMMLIHLAGFARLEKEDQLMPWIKQVQPPATPRSASHPHATCTEHLTILASHANQATT